MPIHRCCLAALACALLAATGACATTAPLCADGEQAVVDERLYFGTQRPGGEVSEAEWAGFVEHAIAAGFPDGFTSWSAQGRWRGEDGRVVREASHVLSLAHRDDDASEAAITGIITAYKARFHQESVLRVRAPACMSL
jgi:hypothetical protein